MHEKILFVMGIVLMFYAIFVNSADKTLYKLHWLRIVPFYLLEYGG